MALTLSRPSALDADLVLEGGGVKGLALVGAIEVLEEHGYRFRRIAGTSAGAIVGALVAGGMPAARELLTGLAELENRFQHEAYGLGVDGRSEARDEGGGSTRQ